MITSLCWETHSIKKMDVSRSKLLSQVHQSFTSSIKHGRSFSLYHLLMSWYNCTIIQNFFLQTWERLPFIIINHNLSLSLSLNVYSKSSFKSFRLWTISACARDLLAAYLRNKSCWRPSHTLTFVPPILASTLTWMKN